MTAGYLITDTEVHEQADCPDATCPDTLVCQPCGQFVCPEHTRDSIDCVDLGTHHEGCEHDCPDCTAARAQDHQEGDAA